MPIIKTENVPLESLKSWEDNPRGITKDGYARLKKQIETLGVYAPLVINEDNIVLSGNMRLRAFQELKIDPVLVTIVEARDKKTMIEYALSANDRAGYYEEEKLAELVLSVPELDLTEFSVDLGKPEGLDKLVESFGPEVEEDEVPEVTEGEPNSKLGEVYELGRHRLLCGDATKKEDVEKLMNGTKADMVFTDPPYNVDYGVAKNAKNKIRTIKNDKQTPEEWEQFCKSVFVLLKEYNDGDIYMWGASGPEGMRMRIWLTEMGCHWSATIVWKKQQLVFNPANYQRMYEPCFYGWFDKSSYVGDRKQTEVWEIDRPLNSKLHPTMKPLALCTKGINNSSKTDDIILDLFGGSFSTMVAAHQTGRICYGMEIDPRYVDVGIKRMLKLDPSLEFKRDGVELDKTLWQVV